jgi:hypothetical protein
MVVDPGRAEMASRMGRIFIWLVIVALFGAAVFFYTRGSKEADEKPVMGETERAPLTRNPLPEPAPPAENQPPSGLSALLPTSLPDLDSSDAAIMQVAGYLVKNPALAALIVPKDVIRRLVVTIDNLGGRAIPLNHVPVMLPGGTFAVRKIGQRFELDPRNYLRYRRHVALLETLDSHDLVNAYVHFYPLFQQAYRELGYPQGYFNDRLIAVIDDVLKTPDVHGPIRLDQPVVYYTWDPKLEALSAGQRLMLRMGPDNAATVKRKLAEIRKELTK